MNPIPELAAVVRELAPDALILVDSVSGLGAVPFEMDAWGVDVVVTGSQKAWMSAPGPGHDRGLAARLGRHGDRDHAAGLPRPARAPRQPRRRADALDAGARRRVPGRRGHPADAGRGRRRRLRPARGVRRGRAGRARWRSASSCSPTSASPRGRSPPRVVPDGLDWKAFNGELKRRGLVLAGGQGKLTGKIFRLGHLGSVTVEEILGAMSVLEFASIGMGRAVRPGAGRRGRPGRRARVLRPGDRGGRRGGCPAHEDPGRRADRRRGRRAPASRATRSTSGRACRATSCARSCPTTTP